MTMADQLWALLPSVYRQRDAEGAQAGFLRGLVEVLAEQAEVVAEDLARLYDSWFVETCDPWVVPYIGDLVGARPLNPVGTAASMPRAYVANTLAYRRRKGTPAALEQLARDVTGWPASVVELYRLAAWSQHLDHLRPAAVVTADLRAAAAMERVDSAFDQTCRTVDVRAPRTGRPNIPDVALYVWRQEPFHVEHSTARPVSDPADGRYTFDPTGRDVPLANEPLPEDSIESLATEHHVPEPLRRRALFDELDQRRAGQVPDDLTLGDLTPDGPSFFGDVPVVRVFADTGSGLQEVTAADLTAADLDDPPSTVTTGWRRPDDPLLAAVDPVLGRLAFRDGLVPTRVEVSYTYLTPGRVGAGPYDRAAGPTTEILAAATFARAVGHGLPGRPNLSRTDLGSALSDWGTPPAGTVGVIAVLDNRTYAAPLHLTVPAGCTLLLTGGVWPDAEGPVGPGDDPQTARISLDERRPVVVGDILVTGGSGAGPDTPRGRLVIDGLVVDGRLTVADGDLGTLQVRHCTLVPAAGAGLTVAAGNADLTIAVDHCITGPVEIAHEGPAIAISTSIVDGVGGAAVTCPQTEVSLDAVTVLGGLSTRTLGASSCVLDGTADVARAQQGCVRYSYVRDTARTPRRYRCLPDLALAAAAADAGGPLPPSQASGIRARLTPALDSSRFGDPGYGQLADRSAVELRTGSAARADMGAYGYLQRPQREANLSTALTEYLRVGLTAGVIHAT